MNPQDEAIRAKLREVEVTPPPGAWARVQARMTEPPPPSPKRAWRKWLLLLILPLLMLGCWHWHRPTIPDIANAGTSSPTLSTTAPAPVVPPVHAVPPAVLPAAQPPQAMTAKQPVAKPKRPARTLKAGTVSGTALMDTAVAYTDMSTAATTSPQPMAGLASVEATRRTLTTDLAPRHTDLRPLPVRQAGKTQKRVTVVVYLHHTPDSLRRDLNGRLRHLWQQLKQRRQTQ